MMKVPADSPHRPAVLVTGASGVIGRAVSLEFARAGWRVGVHYRQRREAAERTAALVKDAGGEAGLFQADVREAKQVRAMVGDFQATARKECSSNQLRESLA